MTSTTPTEPAAPRPWEAHQAPQPAAPQQQTPQQPPYAQPAFPQPRPRASGNLLRRWPVWAQNTALMVGAVAVLVIVFFAGFFTGQATDGPRGGVGTNQDFGPRPFGGTGADGSGQLGSGS